MAEEQSQVEVQSAEASIPSVQETISTVTEAQQSETQSQSQSQIQSQSQSQLQSQDTSANASTPPPPVASGEPAPVTPEPVQKEPPKEHALPDKLTRSSVADVVKERKSTNRHTFANRSTRDFRAFSRAGYMSMMSIKRGSLASFQDRQKISPMCTIIKIGINGINNKIPINLSSNVSEATKNRHKKIEEQKKKLTTTTEHLSVRYAMINPHFLTEIFLDNAKK